MTPNWNGSARGTFTGLTLSHTLDDMSRAVFEGISFGLKDNVDRFEEIGMDCSSVRIVGGSTKSPFWCQMKAVDQMIGGLVILGCYWYWLQLIKHPGALSLLST